jgi:hypothetical protein
MVYSYKSVLLLVVVVIIIVFCVDVANLQFESGVTYVFLFFHEEFLWLRNSVQKLHRNRGSSTKLKLHLVLCEFTYGKAQTLEFG